MTDTRETVSKRYCRACYREMEPDHKDPLLCNLCYEDMEADKTAYDSQADGFKDHAKG